MRRHLTAGCLLLLAAAACRVAPAQSPVAEPGEATVAVSTRTAAASPTAPPYILIDADLPSAVQQAAMAWSGEAGLDAQVESMGALADDAPPGLWAAIGLEENIVGLPEAWRAEDLATVVLEPVSVMAGKSTSTLGPGVVSSEAGFLAGVAAGLTTVSELVGFVPGGDSGESDAFRSGFEEGLRYSCPKCQLDEFADAGRPAFAMDVIVIAPGADLGSGGEDATAAPWLVVFGDALSGPWSERVAARVRPAPEAIVGPAMEGLWDGEPGRAWDFAAGTASLVTEVDSRAVSPGRERLLREAEKGLAEGWLVVGGGSP